MGASAELFEIDTVFSLQGKTVVVTGGSKGLGLAAASGALQSGAHRVFVSSRTSKDCEEACITLNALPKKRPDAQAIAVPADVSNLEGIQALVDQVAKSTDHVDVLLANAGSAHHEAFDKFSDQGFSSDLDINLKAVFFTIQKFTPLLTTRASVRDTSRIIITASVSGVGLSATGEHGTFSYAAAKAGVIHLAKQLAVELGPRHILTNCIAPGYFLTDMARPAIERQGGEEALARTYPNGKLGTGEDFAATVVYLASRAGSHTNGQCIVLDGGGTIGRIRRQ